MFARSSPLSMQAIQTYDSFVVNSRFASSFKSNISAAFIQNLQSQPLRRGRKQMNRTPPADVRRELRREVGFGCPVPGCRNPYLGWHHFDPPWNERNHYEMSGMIALCIEHHNKADGGAFTKDQLRNFKRREALEDEQIGGSFDWTRNELLAVVGGNFFHEQPVIFSFRREPIIFFNRDKDGHLLLNLKMLSKSKDPRARIEDNNWLSIGTPKDLVCPPSGKLLHVTYDNGDMARIEFRELRSAEEVKTRYPESRPEIWEVKFPITSVEIQAEVGETNIQFGPRDTTIGGILMTNFFFSRNGGAAIAIE
jgi:hypothetical protein